MTKVIGLFPLTGNGGIASWTKKFLSDFPDEEFQILAINITPGVRYGTENLYHRIISGLKTLRQTVKKLKSLIKLEKPSLLHTSSSGSIGAYRDYIVAKICKKNNIKCILHCHYGRITEDITAKSPIGFLLRKSMSLFDQIWVLDKRSYVTLKNIPQYSDKVHLTPNPIDVTRPIDSHSKNYKKIGFIGNLIPSKGIFELVEACTNCDVQLDIIGHGEPSVLEEIKRIGGGKIGKNILLHGKVSNEDAIKFMNEIDILALPTYYPWEAFPISILEAMSLSKMVISCKWAAIPDMLTSNDGDLCGLLVKQKSASDIANAINWCQANPTKADLMRIKAYEKVVTTYKIEIIYELYKSLYRNLFS